MKVYLDTTVITLLLFGAQTDPTRHQEVTDFFFELDKGSVQAGGLYLRLRPTRHTMWDAKPSSHMTGTTRISPIVFLF